VAPGRGVCVAVNVRVPRCFGNPQPNCNPVAVSHARRNRDTVPITDADGIRHRVAHGLRDTDTDTHPDADIHTDRDSHTDTDTGGLRIGRGAVLPGA
jgi:hypothetical protein